MSNADSGPATPQGRPLAHPKGRRTRARLVEAARGVFERDGYLDARVVDITSAAGVGHGTFYTYFTSKEEIFAECAREVADALYHAYDAGQGLDARERLRATNRSYVALYEQHARMLALIEQVALFNDQLRELRISIRRHFADRVARAIERMNTEPDGPGLDPQTAANALGAMVDDLCYHWFVLGQPFEREQVLATLDEIWIRALRLEEASPGAAAG